MPSKPSVAAVLDVLETGQLALEFAQPGHALSEWAFDHGLAPVANTVRDTESSSGSAKRFATPASFPEYAAHAWRDICPRLRILDPAGLFADTLPSVSRFLDDKCCEVGLWRNAPTWSTCTQESKLPFVPEPAAETKKLSVPEPILETEPKPGCVPARPSHVQIPGDWTVAHDAFAPSASSITSVRFFMSPHTPSNPRFATPTPAPTPGASEVEVGTDTCTGTGTEYDYLFRNAHEALNGPNAETRDDGDGDGDGDGDKASGEPAWYALEKLCLRRTDTVPSNTLHL
jgi:hypothetical protein